MERKEAVRHAMEQHGYSERRACRLMVLNRGTARRPAGPDRDAELSKRLRELVEVRKRFGSPRMTILLRQEGWAINHNRVERVYGGSRGRGSAAEYLQARRNFFYLGRTS